MEWWAIVLWGLGVVYLMGVVLAWCLLRALWALKLPIALLWPVCALVLALFVVREAALLRDCPTQDHP